MAQLIAAKKKVSAFSKPKADLHSETDNLLWYDLQLRTFRQQKAKTAVSSPTRRGFDLPSSDIEPLAGHKQIADEDLVVTSNNTPQVDVPGTDLPAFPSSPSPSPAHTTSPIPLVFLNNTTPSRRNPSISHTRNRSRAFNTLEHELIQAPPGTTMLAGRRKREALRPIEVQDRSGSGSSLSECSASVLNSPNSESRSTGSKLGGKKDWKFGTPATIPMTSSPRLADAHSAGRGSRDIGNSSNVAESSTRQSKRRSMKKESLGHGHSGSAEGLRQLGSGWTWKRPGTRSPAGSMGRDVELEERGIKTAPARLEGCSSGAVVSVDMDDAAALPPLLSSTHNDRSAPELDFGAESSFSLDFNIPMDIDASASEASKPFAFPQQQGGFGFPSAPKEQLTPSTFGLPELAVVPSTPAGEEFVLPPVPVSEADQHMSSSPTALGLGFSAGPPEDGSRKRFEGFKFGKPAAESAPGNALPPKMAAFSFGKKPIDPGTVVHPEAVVGSPSQLPIAGLPSLPSTPKKKKRHSHTRSGSVSSYHAFLPNTGVLSAPRSPAMLSTDSSTLAPTNVTSLVARSLSPDNTLDGASPIKAPGEIRSERESALRTLEGARNGLTSASTSANSLTWPLSGGDGLFGRDGRKLSIGGLGSQGKRRSRKSLMMEREKEEASEVQIPDLDSDEETPIQETLSPNPFGFNIAAPSSPRPPTKPRPLSGSISAPASTRNSFELMFKAPPPANAPGFGLSLAPTMGASVEPHLNTLIEEDEPEEEEQLATPTTPVRIRSPPAPFSNKLRPLRLLSMSIDSTSSIKPTDPDESVSDQHSFSLERTRSSSIGSEPFSPGSNAPSERSTRRTSFSNAPDDVIRTRRRPRSTLGWGKRASNVSLSGSVRTLNEVSEAIGGEDYTNTPRAADNSDPQSSAHHSARVRRRRSTTAHSIALGSYESCEDVTILKERLAEAAMERLAMEQDIQDWRGRCGDLEKQLRAERQQSGVLRDRVRRRK
jgi:hypothetical protein